MTRRVRYDGIADWYDAQSSDPARRRDQLTEVLGAGTGLCLDVGCGTGRDLESIATTGRIPVGVELSADQLRLAAPRWPRLVRGDAERLPFRDDVFKTVTALWISTDVDDFGETMQEVGRVLAPGGLFVFFGVHPCFNGPCVENRADGARIVHPTYRRAERHLSSPWWGRDGIRTRVGGMRHLPLAELLGVIIDAGLRITRVVEPGDEAIPHALIITAEAG